MPPMSTSAASTDLASSLEFRDILSDDGTTLRAWTNDPHGQIDGPTVVLCNGLGTNPWCWPALLDPECGVRVVSWNHRGVGGSERPADPSHIEIEHFVQDGLSVMDHFGIDRAVLMGWSMGVNTMFELAYRHPERVAGLFAVAGVPGDTFATMLGPLRLPHLLARTVTVNIARTAQIAGKLLNPIARRITVGPRAVFAVSHSGFMLPLADPDLARICFNEFLTTPIDWYMKLALGTSKHARVSLSAIQVPARFVAARWDLLAGSRDMASAAARMEEADFIELPGSHFIQMERPDVVHALLLDFLQQVL